MYVPLWCKSNGSFLEGASHPEELVAEAHRLGLPAIAITDRDGVYGVVRAYEKARELGISLIIGAEISVDDESKIVLLAADRAGYANLCQLITDGRRRSEKGKSVVAWREVAARAAGLVALWGGDRSALIGDIEPDGIAGVLREAFGDRLYALVARHRRAEEMDAEARLRGRAARYEIAVAAGVEVLYHTPARRQLQDVLTCIRHGVTIFTAGRLIKPNAEHDLKSGYAFSSLFADDPAAVARTLEIAARLKFSLADLRYRYPSERLPDGKTTSQWLRELADIGAHKRYGADIPADVSAQLDKELRLIESLDYGGYFLTMYEVVEFCRAQNILCQGRGSAANSVVCYCLGITAVDPVRMKLLFERFLSKERAEPPDIDLDIEHERREEVIQEVYRKYGRERSAMVANIIRYRSRSAVRDVGKALGLSESDLDRTSRLLSHDTVERALAQADVGSNGMYGHLLRLAQELENFPRHLSIHPGGFLLGHEPVSTLVPIENATMENRTVIQWDKDDVETLGLFKVDLLGLGALTHLHRAFDLIQARHGKKLTIADIPEGDEPTYEMIRRGDTVGVFQIESRAQMAMLPRLKPETYYDLVIEVSIVRPGPITGGMVHPYLQRRANPKLIDYPHPSLIPVLQKTLGVPLFQEQVMQLAVVAADYTPGEADQLRRDMAAWRRTGRIEQHRERLISRMEKKGIAPEFAERVYKQICGFGEYGFPESHAASFALISYAGSYLKRHYPVEFTTALLNAQPMGFYSPATIVEDAKRHGVEVLPIDAQASSWQCSIEDDAVRIGLRYVKGLGEKQVMDNDKLRDFETLDLRSRTALAEAGAMPGPRREALWRAWGVLPPTPIAVDGEQPVGLPELERAETIAWDYRSSGLSTHGHPLAPMRESLRQAGLPDARSLAQLSDGQRARYAGLVICRQRPGTASGVVFMTLEDETGFVNVVIWTQIFETYSLLAKTQAFLGISGRVQRQDDVVHLIADELWAPADKLRPAALVFSRDFR